MSGVQQTCPLCSWARFVELPQTANRAHDETVAKHVARSLQWEWQAHVERDHGKEMAYSYAVLTLDAFESWVEQESQPPVLQETPPSEGVGKTVRVNLPVITPEQAKQLAEAVERTMVSVADSIQRFAEHSVPAIHAAQQTLTDGLRRIVEQRTRSGCACNGTQGDHQPGTDGCLYKPYVQPDDLLASQQRWAERFGALTVHQPPLSGDRPYGTVGAEICSNCQRLAGEPHGLPSCAELS